MTRDGSYHSGEREQDSAEVAAILAYYTARSAVFRHWTETRQQGISNPYVSAFFEGKERGRDSGLRSSAQASKPLFNRFLRYACDIDNGVQFSARAAEIAERQGCCWFLDFGFAPGGMSELLLAAHPAVRGVGVTLAPEEGGNSYPDDFASSKGGRFVPVVADVIRMARDGASVAAAAGLPPDFPGFDLVIVGITIHQKAEGEEYNELKDLLHLCQLALTWPAIRPGGACLMRMHLSLRLIDFHLLGFMLTHFAGDGGPTAGHTPGAGVAAATKPMSEFAMRKTFWVLYQGFDPAASEAHGSAARLAAAVAKQPDGQLGGCYAFDGATGVLGTTSLRD